MHRDEMRELDVWVAENIMGWWSVKDRAGWCDVDGDWHCNLDKRPGSHAYAKVLSGKHVDEMWVEEIPYFTTDIGSAWEILGKMQSEWHPSVTDNGCGKWECSFESHKWDYGGPVETIYEEADTAPLAICFAAKKLFMEKNPNG